MAKRDTFEEFTIKANKTHSNKYTYSSDLYIDSTTKINIKCPHHGVWLQTPGNHISGKGCPKCGGTSKLSFNEFVTKASILHGDTYNYSSSDYLNARKKVSITCSSHGEFKQRASAHLEGHGCPKCGKDKQVRSLYDTLDTFIGKAVIKHNEVYTYSKAIYLSTHTKLLITCRIHGDFSQTPNAHLTGSGCPQCATYGFNKALPAILYHFKINGIYKIGITNRTVKERYNKLDYSLIEDLITWNFDSGAEAYNYEQDIISQNKEFAYTGPSPFTDGTSTTECFTKNIKDTYDRI